ncbi:ArsR/SmtB family transcription factor [Nonomuraea sp. JJY05]|uniref:ArsR/SmtB family transcription factor n=1 Tax=Nonomuraea sp. JJY05 TaxID=3350255 RepID=UPI00373ECF21
MVDHVQQLLDAVFPFFKGLGDPTRQLIVRALVRAGGSANVSELVEATGLPQSTVSRQLALLRTHGIVSSTRTGANRTYAIGIGPATLDALEKLVALLRSCTDEPP